MTVDLTSAFAPRVGPADAAPDPRPRAASDQAMVRTADEPEPSEPREPRVPSAVRTVAGVVGWLLFLGFAQAVMAGAVDVPFLRPVLALATLLGIPTLVLYRRFELASDSEIARLFYAFGASLLGLVLAGLLVDLALPLVGVDRPLRPAVLAVTWFVLDAALLLWRPSMSLVPWPSVVAAGRLVVHARWEPAQALAAGALALSVMGAIRLNNNAGGQVAFLALVCSAAALLALMVRPRGTLGRDVRTVGLVATALLLATSLRGWAITGHDIQAEFLAFRLTNDGQLWQMSSLQNAYNACLSVNILPTVLAQATGASGELVFKVLLQLVFATVPVLTFLFARRIVGRRPAVVAAILTMAFPTFFNDMPYLVRQEIAFFFLALLLLAATEPDRAGARSRWLVMVFGLGVVLSHYSTTYVMLLALVIALVARALLTPLRRMLDRRSPGTDLPPLVLLHPATVAFLVAATLLWAGPITHTGGHASEVARETVKALVGKGGDGPASSDVSWRLFSRDHTTPRERMDHLVRDTMKYRAQQIPRRDRLVEHLGRPELRPRLLPATTAPPTLLGRGLDLVGIDPVEANKAVRFGSAVVMQVALFAGLVWLVTRRRRRPEPSEESDDPEADDAPQPRPHLVDGGGLAALHEFRYVAVGATIALGLIVLVPNLSVEYGVLRAFQQTMLVVAPVMAAGLWMLLRPFGRHSARLLVAVPLVLLLLLTGVLPAFLGGQQQRIALSSSGPYYDRFYATDSDVQAVSWLASVDHEDLSNQRVIANRNVDVRMLAATGNRAPVSDRMFPTLLTKHSYVFVDGQITRKGVSTVFYSGDLLTYVYPLHDLGSRLNLVYSSPRERIYR